jgi:hypothetical protein
MGGRAEEWVEHVTGYQNSYTLAGVRIHRVFIFTFFFLFFKKRNEKTKRKEVLFHVAFSHGAHLTERWELNERAAQAHYPPSFLLVSACLIILLLFEQKIIHRAREGESVFVAAAAVRHISQKWNLYFQFGKK